MKKLAQIVSLLATLLLSASPAFAQNFTVPRPPGVQIENLGVLISNAIGITLILAGVMVFVYLVWGGIQWITSGGDKAKTEEARARITAALIGLAIVAAAWAVMQLVSYFFGINLQNPEIPTGY